MKKIAIVLLFLQVFVGQVFAQEYKYHIVKPGETTAEIAKKYNISEETLFTYNPDARSGIRPEGKLVVPINAAAQTRSNRDLPATQTNQEVKFITHRVKKQETLYSLSKQYNVSIEGIKRYNTHLYSEELRRGEKIRIPEISSFTPPPIEREEKQQPPSKVNPFSLTVKEHVVLPKETLYGISRKYNITIAELQRLNPTMENLQPGMVLTVKNGDVDKVIEVEGNLFKYYQVEPKETLFSLTRRFGISADSLVSLNPALEEGLKSGMVLRIPNREVTEIASYEESTVVNLANRLSNFKEKKIVLMLPFNSDKAAINDSLQNYGDIIKRDKVMQLSLDFYSGVLMAVDSAKALGISTDLTVLDTRQNQGQVNVLLNTHNFNGVDAVIGPLLQATAETAARGLQSKNIPVISPLTKKEVNAMNNFLQTRPSDEMLSDALIAYLQANSAGKNIIIIADDNSFAKRQKLAMALPAARVITANGSSLNQGQVAGALDKSRPNWVVLESSRVGLLSNATSYLNSIATPYNIRLFTTDKNNSYESDNISNRHLGKLNFTFPAVDRGYDYDTQRHFIKKFENKYGVTPNTYAIRGFDVTLDLLLRLASADNLYASLDAGGTTQYIENKFDYNKRTAGGYQNKALYILAYDEDLNLKVVQ